MASPFPGIDPYIENPALWSGFHHALLSAMQERLAPALRPRYLVRVEERIYVTNEEDPAYRLIVPDLHIAQMPIRTGRMTAQTPGGVAVAQPVPVGDLLDPEIREHRLEILDREERSVVTVIEFLSSNE